MENIQLINSLKEDIEGIQENIDTVDALLVGLKEKHSEELKNKRRRIDETLEELTCLMADSLDAEITTVTSTLELSNENAINAFMIEQQEIIDEIYIECSARAEEERVAEFDRRRIELLTELSQELQRIPETIEKRTAERLSARIAEIRAAQEQIQIAIIE